MQATLERLHERREERGDEGGFTLIELLIVIVILGILAAIVVFAVQNLSSSSSKASCGSDQKTVETAVEAYKAQVGVYPGGTLPTGVTVGTPSTAAVGSYPAAAAVGIDDLMSTYNSGWWDRGSVAEGRSSESHALWVAGCHHRCGRRSHRLQRYRHAGNDCRWLLCHYQLAPNLCSRLQQRTSPGTSAAWRHGSRWAIVVLHKRASCVSYAAFSG